MLVRPCLSFLFLLYLIASPAAAAQASVPEALPPGLSVTSAGRVHAIAPLPQGGHVVGGEFSSVDGLPRPGLARIDAQGALDRSWVPPRFDGPVGALAVDAEGNVYVGGRFPTVDGLERGGLARLGPDGRLDVDWSASLEKLDGSAPQVDRLLFHEGYLYVAGDFSSVQGVPRKRLARIGAEGRLDLGWGQGLAGANAPSLITRALLIDGDWLIVAGSVQDGRALRLWLADGSIDPDWLVPSAPGFQADAAAIAEGWLYLGGSQRLNRFRLDNASHDTNWRPPGRDKAIHALLVVGQRLLLGGNFTAIDGQPRAGLAAVSTVDARLLDWTPFASDGHSRIDALAQDADGSLIAGGDFDLSGSRWALSLARMAADGRALPAPQVEVPGEVYALAVQSDGGLVLGGNFSRVNGEARENLARLDSRGQVDPHWTPRATGGSVLSLLAVDGAVFVGGDSDGALVEGGPPSSLVRLAGPTGTPDLAWAARTSYDIRALVRDSQGWLYAGGDFCLRPACTSASLVRYYPDGRLDLAWLPQIDGPVTALAISPQGVYVGGDFRQVALKGDAQQRPYLARLTNNGVDAWYPEDGELNGPVTAIATDPRDAGVYVGGRFTAIGERSRPHVAKLDIFSGTLYAWRPLVTGSHGDTLFAGDPGPEVNAIIATADAVYLGGSFSGINLRRRSGFAKIDREVTTGAVFQPNLHAWAPRPLSPTTGRLDLARMALMPGGRIVLAGQFECIGRQPRASLALLPTEAARLFGNGFERADDAHTATEGVCPGERD